MVHFCQWRRNILKISQSANWQSRDDQLSADIPISMKPGKTMVFEFVLKILWDEHLW